MENISEELHLNISETQCENVAPNRRISLVGGDSAVAVQVVTENTEALLVDTTVVIQKKIVLNEKVIIPRESLNRNCQSPRLNPVNGPHDVSRSSEVEPWYEEVEMASQESVDSKMDISSQESDTSIMEMGSQEVNEKNTSSQDTGNVGSVEDSLPHENRVVENSLPKENSACGQNEAALAEDLATGEQEGSLNRILSLREEVLSIREDAVKVRERAVAEREAVIRCRGNRRYLTENNYPNPKRKKLPNCCPSQDDSKK